MKIQVLISLVGQSTNSNPGENVDQPLQQGDWGNHTRGGQPRDGEKWIASKLFLILFMYICHFLCLTKTFLISGGHKIKRRLETACDPWVKHWNVGHIRRVFYTPDVMNVDNNLSRLLKNTLSTSVTLGSDLFVIFLSVLPNLLISVPHVS